MYIQKMVEYPYNNSKVDVSRMNFFQQCDLW